MSIPHDLSLKTSPDGLILQQLPSAIVTNTLAKYAAGKVLVKKNLNLNASAIKLSGRNRFNKNAYWIDAAFIINDSKKIGFNVIEKPGSGRTVTVGYDAEKEVLFVDCTGSEKANKSPEHLVQTAPMKAVNGLVNIKLLLDKSSLEVFGNNGERVISTMIYPDKDATGLSVFSDGKATVKLLKIWDMAPKGN